MVRPYILHWLEWPENSKLVQLLFMVGACALVWVPATLLTKPVDQGTLKQFFARVQTPGWWKPVAIAKIQNAHSWKPALLQWIIATIALMATIVGPLQVMVGSKTFGWGLRGIAGCGWMIALLTFDRINNAS